MTDIEIRKILGEKISFFRKQKGLTQESLASKIEKSVDTISNIERAKNAVSFEIVVLISNALEISLDDLISSEKIPLKKSKDYKYIKRIISAMEGKNEKIKSVATNIVEEVCGIE